jgi:hypothetical protein
MKKLWIFVIMVIALVSFNTQSYAQTAGAVVSGVTAGATLNYTVTSDPALGAAALESADNPLAYRGFAIGTPVTFAQLISHFGPRSNSGGFNSVENLLLYVSIFTEGALENMADGKADFSVVNDFKGFPKAGELRGAKWILIIIQDRKTVKDANGKDMIQVVRYPNAAFRGYVSSWSTKEKQKMQHVMAQAGLAAIKKGCNILEITAEGASIDTVSDGWGVGFNANGAYMAPGSNQPTSFGSTAGIGYSTSQAGMRDLPWVNGNGLVVPDAVIEKMLATLPLDVWSKAKEETPQTGNHVKKP